jgi:hypothetical protein
MSLLSVLAVFPYVLTLQGEILKQIGQPILIIFVLQLIQSLILFSIAIFIGLYLVKKINFNLPLLESFLVQKNYKKVLNDISLLSIVLGIITALVIYIADYLFTLQGASISTSQNLAQFGRN